MASSKSSVPSDARRVCRVGASNHVRHQCQGRRARSILALPLITRANFVGVLYLENNLAARVFAPGRIAVLALLASQAAIALENTRLYRDLEQREAKIRRLVDANIIGIFIFDRENRIIEANDAFLQMVGYDREDFVSGRVRWTDLTPPEWRDLHSRAGAELKMTGTVQPYEREYFRKDGNRVPALIGSATIGENGNESVCFVLDLTESKRAEGALRQSEERFRTARALLLRRLLGDRRTASLYPPGVSRGPCRRAGAGLRDR